MKTLVALGGLLVLLGALAYWTLAKENTRGGSSGSNPTPSAGETGAPGETTTPAELAPAASTDAAPGPGAATSGEPANREALAGQGLGRILSGRVRLPAGAPADESLRILAFTEAVKSEEVYGVGGALAPPAPEAKEPRNSSWNAEARVAADGTFRLALGTDGPVHLAVDGRFLYSAPLTAVAAGASTAEVEVQLGACMTGELKLPAEISDPAGFLAALRVRLGPDPTQISLAATSSYQSRLAKPEATGRYELRALKPDQVHALLVESDACADLTRPGLKFTPGETRTMDLQLKLGATVRGQVVDERGAPVAQAEVRAAESGMWGSSGSTRTETNTDESGRFVLEHVSEGKSMLLATKDGYLESKSLPVELVDREDRSGLSLELGRGASLSGVVRLPDGNPAEGAEIDVSFDLESMMGVGAANATRGADGKGRSDANGRFEVTGLGKGPFTVVASLERELADGEKEKWSARLPKVAPERHDLELVLIAPCTLAGRVVDAAGQPIERFHVSASQPGAVFFDPGQQRGRDFVEATGAFELKNLEPGMWQVSARAAGFGPMAPLELQLPRTGLEPLVLTLMPEAGVAGVVLDPDGRPIAGARVTIPGDLADTMRRMRGDQRPPEALSDGEGRFHLTGLGSDVKAIHALHERFAPSASHPVELAPGAQITDVKLQLSRGGRVTGEVYGTEGELAADTQIVAQNRASFEMSMSRTDGQGAFAFERLAAGPWTITAMLGAGTAEGVVDSPEATSDFMSNLRFEMIDLADGEEKHVVLGAPPEAPVTVHGIVRHGKEPVTQGLVSFVPDGMKSLSGMKMKSLGSDGTFTLQLDHPGEYIVSVQIQSGGGAFQQDTVEFRRKVPEVEEHTLELDLPLAGIRGLVRGSDGTPTANMRVSLTVEGGVQTGSMLGGHYSEATTGADGRYTFRYLRPGTYTVAAGGALFGGAFGTAASGGRRLRSGLSVGEGQLIDGVDFELATPCDIKGRVRDSNGAPVADASIFVRNAEGRIVDRFSMTSSGPDGSFTYTGVEPGEYFVSARTKELASSDSAPVRANPDGTAEVELVVLAGSKLVIEVVDAEGNSVQALVTVFDSQGREVQGMLGFSELSSAFTEGFDSTKQTIGPVPPGSYTVVAVGMDGTRTQKPVNLDGQAERRMKLRLKE